jgi:sec-independent protein translocase protein TatA
MEYVILLGAFGPWQVVLIVAVALLLFGGKKIPELMRGLGKGIKDFKDATADKDPKDTNNEVVQKTSDSPNA